MHLEEKIAASKLEKSGPISFPATGEACDEVRILGEQLAALSTEFRIERRGERGGRINSTEETRTCNGCMREERDIFDPTAQTFTEPTLANLNEAFGGAACAFPASMYHENEVPRRSHYMSGRMWRV